MPPDPIYVQSRLDFQTHLKYAQLIARLSAGLSATCTLSPTLPLADVDQGTNKRHLAKLTFESLKNDAEIIAIEEEYAVAAVLWLPIKAYYGLFHIMCAIDHLLTGDQSKLRASHGACITRFNTLLKQRQLTLSDPLLNVVFDASILGFRTAPGDHLRNDVDDATLYKLLMKKVAVEKLMELRRTSHLRVARTHEDKAKLARLKQRLSVSVFDFFYQMRLRLNYRDLRFVDNVGALPTKEYFAEYLSASKHMARCLETLRRSVQGRCP